jgi:4-amino-4-deoxy-L-arabinose transferase-like glycosyltransferase
MSDDYFFTMPIVQGLGIVCCLFYVYQEKYLYLLPIPVLLLSISFNARIGFTPMVIFLALSLIFIFKKSAIKPRTILFFVALISIIVLFFNPDLFWNSKLSQGVSFGYSFFDATSKFIFSDKYDETANYKVLRDMVFFPDHEKLLFGTGESIFFSNQRNSDIGYINQLFYGGIVYLMLQFSVLFVTFFYVFKSMKFTQENLKMKVFLIVCLLTFLISNIKGYFFLVKPGLRLIYLIFFLVYFINISMKRDVRTQ